MHMKSHSLYEYSSLYHAFIILGQSKQIPLVLGSEIKILEVQFLLQGLFRNVTSSYSWLKIIFMSLYKYIPTLTISLHMQVNLELNFLFLLFPLKKTESYPQRLWSPIDFNFLQVYKTQIVFLLCMYWYSWFTVSSKQSKFFIIERNLQLNALYSPRKKK